MERNNQTCETAYFNVSNFGTIREWNRNATENVWLVVFQGYFLFVVALFGTFGNILNAWILGGKEMRSAMTILLIGLAISDTFVSVGGVFVFSLPAFADYYPDAWSKYRKWYAPFFHYHAYPFWYIGKTASAYFTLALTTQRFIAVETPWKSIRWGDRRSLEVCFGIALISIIFNVTRWWEIRVACVWWPDDEEFIYRTRFGYLYFDSIYAILYRGVATFCFMGLVPFLCLFVFNFLIYREIINANRRYFTLSQIELKNVKLGYILGSIVVVFLVCNVPHLVCQIIEGWVRESETLRVNVLFYVADLLVTVNSSANFIIYMFGKKFRRIFKRRVTSVITISEKSASAVKKKSLRCRSDCRQRRDDIAIVSAELQRQSSLPNET